MGRLYMKVKTLVLSTSFGKWLRSRKVRSGYKMEDAVRMVKEYYPDLEPEAQKQRAEDMMQEAKNYSVGFDEYIMYHFENREYDDRRQFIPTRERALYCERLNAPKNQILFDDKGKTYEVFRKYFKRDLTEVLGWNSASLKALGAFVDKHPSFIVKPFNGGNGRGIRIVDLAKIGSFEALCAELKKQYPSGFVAEELIRQVDVLSAVHPSSVNTLRVFTIRFDDRVEFLPLAWRVGRGGACVDNGGSGGIFCALDDTGVVVSTCDEKGRSYDVHPDTGHPLIGFRLPRFEEAKQLAAELAQVVPDNRYCGWDLALTEDGWVMQEGNWQGGLVAFQCPMQTGCRRRMDAIMEELGL